MILRLIHMKMANDKHEPRKFYQRLEHFYLGQILAKK
jgi:hypothetical protein